MMLRMSLVRWIAFYITKGPYRRKPPPRIMRSLTKPEHQYQRWSVNKLDNEVDASLLHGVQHQVKMFRVPVRLRLSEMNGMKHGDNSFCPNKLHVAKGLRLQARVEQHRWLSGDNDRRVEFHIETIRPRTGETPNNRFNCLNIKC
jgi:hypothetical protein